MLSDVSEARSDMQHRNASDRSSADLEHVCHSTEDEKKIEQTTGNIDEEENKMCEDGSSVKDSETEHCLQDRHDTEAANAAVNPSEL